MARWIFSLFLLPALALGAESEGPATLTWHDTARDVYVDGKLDRRVQTLSCSELRRLALVPPDSDGVVILDPVSKTMARAPKSVFVFEADRSSATTPRTYASSPGGDIVVPEARRYLASVDGHSLLVVPHQGHAGPMTAGELWQTVPIWWAIYQHYEPDAAAVAELRQETPPTQITIIFGTWCSDSEYHVPRLLKALHEASNRNLDVKLVSIGPDLLAPLDFVEREHLINVPTVIVERRGKEIGRYVETPRSERVESDLAAIVSGKPLPRHPGRWKHGQRLAGGAYSLRDASGRRGAEEFEIFSADGNGIVVHSTIEYPGETIEVWASLDKTRSPDFAEVTRHRGSHLERARYNLDKNRFSVHSRGDEGGIGQQDIEVPSDVSLTLPATPTRGWPALRGVPRSVSYVVSEGTIGKLDTEMVSFGQGASHTVPGRSLIGQRVYVTTARGRSEMILYSTWCLPLIVTEPDGAERHLVRLDGDLPKAELIER
ncbi:MAG TPA: hypothetical protein VEZ11_07840 [Thermoanaerobaculia bacterium]|nr:hypothetical protein [Thermoanaerobaculia bacterium]